MEAQHSRGMDGQIQLPTNISKGFPPESVVAVCLNLVGSRVAQALRAQQHLGRSDSPGHHGAELPAGGGSSEQANNGFV